jgi:hypothetical protein
MPSLKILYFDSICYDKGIASRRRNFWLIASRMNATASDCITNLFPIPNPPRMGGIAIELSHLPTIKPPRRGGIEE